MVTTSQPQKPPQKPPSRTAGAQRCYPHRNALASGPNTDPRISRAKALNCELQAQVRARRSALQFPLTADMGPDETMQRDQELDLHRLRQTEYRVRFSSAILDKLL